MSLSQSYIIEYDVSLNVLKRSGYLIVNNTEESIRLNYCGFLTLREPIIKIAKNVKVT